MKSNPGLKGVKLHRRAPHPHQEKEEGSAGTELNKGTSGRQANLKHIVCLYLQVPLVT